MKEIRNYDSMFDFGANDSLANEFAGLSMISNLNSTVGVPTKKDQEVERRIIEKTLKILDKREIDLWNAQEQVNKIIKENK